jgi:hypothetical protein
VTPEIHTMKFFIDEKSRKFLYDNVIKCFQSFHFDGINYNFKLNSEFDYFCHPLYDEFLKFSQQIYGPFDVAADIKKECWVYVNNIYHRNTIIHNHTKTSTINGVFYLNVPCNQTGKINFYDNDLSFIGDFQPENDDLIIFRSTLNHKPEISMTEEFRIAFNMEIKLYDEKGDLIK